MGIHNLPSEEMYPIVYFRQVALVHKQDRPCPTSIRRGLKATPSSEPIRLAMDAPFQNRARLAR
jgi:hypothetical protein